MELIVSSIPSVKGKISVVTSNLLNLGRRNWIEYDGKGMHCGLEKPLLVN